MSKRNIKKIKAFKEPLSGSPIVIDKMYIDSTFFSKNYLHFPEQFCSTKRVCDIIEEWLSESANHIISLKVPARYGYEYLLINIAKRTKQKIHINDSELVKYKYIPELDHIFTSTTSQSRIHACFDYLNKNGKYLSCNPQLDQKLIRVIKPTAMIWKDWQINTDFVQRESNEQFRICYSNHSSYTEISDFLKYLKPKSVEFNVVPKDQFKQKEMLDELNKIMKSVDDTTATPLVKSNQTQLNWDNLGKIAKLNFKSSQQINCRSETKEILCPPKRRKL